MPIINWDDLDHTAQTPENAFLDKLLLWLEANTPKGLQVIANQADVHLGRNRWALKVTCSGRNAIMGYECVLSPGHEGDCYSAIKGVDFKPDWEYRPCRP